MVRNILFFSIAFLLYANGLTQAQPQIIFLEKDHDFGQIEEGAIAVHDFVFTNKGDQPLIISSVKASCGCTTPFWTKEPVLPGKQGVIKASYNSSNRPGGFHKSITVTSNAITPSRMVYIKGTAVKSQQLKPLFTAEELAKAPEIEIVNSHLQLGNVQIGKQQTLAFQLKNGGADALEIKGIYAACKCFRLPGGQSVVVDPNSETTLKVEYHPSILGENTHEAYIFSNALVQPKYQITVSSTVIPLQNNASIVKESPSKLTF